MARILVSEFIDARALAQLRAAHDVVYDPALVDDVPRLLAEARSAHALITRNRTQVRGDLLAALERCRVVGRLGVGLDNVDVAGCAARGIVVIPATGANAVSVAEYVVTAALLLVRGAYGASADVVAGRWPRVVLGAGHEIAGRTLGIVGFGSIGRVTAKLAQGLGLEVVACDAMLAPGDAAYAEAGVRALTLEALVASADIVSLHVPLVAETRNLFDAARIASMKRGAVLINSARGGIVDEAAVAAALRSGHLGGAALDVFEREPFAPSALFDGCPNLLLTPHIAGVTVESNERVSMLIAGKVIEALG